MHFRDLRRVRGDEAARHEWTHEHREARGGGSESEGFMHGQQTAETLELYSVWHCQRRFKETMLLQCCSKYFL